MSDKTIAQGRLEEIDSKPLAIPGRVPKTRSKLRPSARDGKLHRWMRRLVALLLGLILAGLSMEGAVLMIVGEQSKFPRHVVGAPWELRYNQPGASYRHKSPDGTWYFQINQNGMRADRDYSYTKRPGVQRILSLGDSFTIGFEVDYDQTFSRVMEDELNAAGRRIEVLNAGVSGFGNAEECLYLERELMKYQPDLVIVSFYANDLDDNVRTALFALEDGRLVPAAHAYVPMGSLGDFLNTNTCFNFFNG